MDQLIKGRKYILFGNFPAPEKTAEEISNTLGVDVVCMLSKTDNVSVMEYMDEDHELAKTKFELEQREKEISKLMNQLKRKGRWF